MKDKKDPLGRQRINPILKIVIWLTLGACFMAYAYFGERLRGLEEVPYWVYVVMTACASICISKMLRVIVKRRENRKNQKRINQEFFNIHNKLIKELHKTKL